MNLTIKTKNLEIDHSLDNLIKKRMTAVSKMINAFQESAELFVEVERATKHHKKGDIFRAEAIVSLPGRKLVARAHGGNLGKIIGSVRDEMRRELRKYKTKIVELPRKKYRKIKKSFF